jgi:hypothetical protein
LHGAVDAATAESLFDEGQIHIAGHQVRREAVFQAVRVALLGQHARCSGNGFEQAKEGCAIESPAFL